MSVSTSAEVKVARALRHGDLVRCPDGNAGVLTELRAFGPSTVTLGGKFVAYDWHELRVMTAEEIIETGLAGVGCNQRAEVARLSRRRRR